MINSIKNSPSFSAACVYNSTYSQATNALHALNQDEYINMKRNFNKAWESLTTEKTDCRYELSAEEIKGENGPLYVGHLKQDNKIVYSTEPMPSNPVFNDAYCPPALNKGLVAAQALIEYDKSKQVYNRYLSGNKDFDVTTRNIVVARNALNYITAFSNSFNIENPTDKEQELIDNIKTSSSKLKDGFAKLAGDVNSLKDILSERTKNEAGNKNNHIDLNA